MCTIREVYWRTERGKLVRYGVLGCGHVLCLTDKTRNKVGQRTACPLCK